MNILTVADPQWADEGKTQIMMTATVVIEEGSPPVSIPWRVLVHDENPEVEMLVRRLLAKEFGSIKKAA
jgi:hypothetical protein